MKCQNSNLLYPSELTETCGASFASVPDVMSMVGTVGVLLPNVEVCLQSVPELRYDPLSETVHGEVCIKGFIFVEVYMYLLATINVDDLTENGSTQLCGNNGIYFLQVQSTCVACFLKEIYPGHVEKWQPDGALKLIDRKKNIFKLSQGEYVAVENLENIYSSCSVVESVCDHFPKASSSCMISHQIVNIEDKNEISFRYSIGTGYCLAG